MNSIKTAVESWSAWVPDDNRHDVRMDVSFVDSVLRRRLSTLSRMAVWAAHDCLRKSGFPENVALVFSSQYGEFGRTSEILQTLVKKDLVSPMVFSQSVHNTSAGIFSIAQKSREPAITISASRCSFELAFLESWMELCADNRSKVLLVYHDEAAPVIYNPASWNVKKPMALALLLAPCAQDDETTALQLNWTAQKPQAGSKNSGAKSGPPLILDMLRAGKGSCTMPSDRLEWVWKVVNKSGESHRSL